MNLPEKTVERLSIYRRALLESLSKGKMHIFSYELAALLNITPVQVRRDIMLIGYTGTQRKGYDIEELVKIIGRILDTDEGLKVAVIGVGNLGRSITGYFNGKRSKLNIVAVFDIDLEKVNRIISGVRCYHINEIPEIVKNEKISIGIITVPPENAKNIAETLVMAGIKAILNFTSVPLNVSSHVYLEEYDMVTSIEKAAFFVKKDKDI